MTTRLKMPDEEVLPDVAHKVKLSTVRLDYDNNDVLQRTVAPHTITVHVFGKQDSSNTASRVRDRALVAPRSTNLDSNWFRAQSKYVAGLPFDDLLTAASYTNSSQTFIGLYQHTGKAPARSSVLKQDNHITPLFPQLREVVDKIGSKAYVKTPYVDPNVEQHKAIFGDKTRTPTARWDSFDVLIMVDAFTQPAMLEAVIKYERDLQRIIRNAPPVQRPIVVYRGTKGDSFEKHRTSTYVSTSFSSASFTTTHPFRFSNGGYQRLTLMPGTRALLLAGVNQWDKNGEYEILINKGEKYEFKSRNALRWVLSPYGEFTQVRVTDIVVT